MKNQTISGITKMSLKGAILLVFISCLVTFLATAMYFVFSKESDADFMTGMESYSNTKNETTVIHVKKAAEQGDPNAQYEIGKCYEEGKGVEQSYQEAAKWYRKVLDNSDFKTGKVFYWFPIETELGYTGFIYKDNINLNGLEQYYLARIYEKKSSEEYRQSAELGYAPAQYELYLDLLIHNNDDAENWRKKAAEQGYFPALESLYNDGYYDESIKHIRFAAEHNDGRAQFILANAYALGQGVEQNKEEATEWYLKAVENGSEDAKKALDQLK